VRYHNYLKYILYFSLTNVLFPHCQIPCGIYNDSLRIIQIKEHFETINKAMIKIRNLSQETDPLSKNQLNRWTIIKEDHANKTQRIIADYFLTQRIKSSNEEKYVDQIIYLQKLLVAAMKCKQTVDINNAYIGQQLITQFVKVYFDEHGIKHLNNLE
tara:strand:+ start:456 stop:926 length:471 start_codon:yes stop_codon:yes gene_type:complete